MTSGSAPPPAARHHPQALHAAYRCGTISFADILALVPRTQAPYGGRAECKEGGLFSASLIYLIDVKGVG